MLSTGIVAKTPYNCSGGKGERKIVAVYIDVIFFKNFILDFALLAVLNKTLKASGKTFFLFLGGALSGIGAILPYLLPVSLPMWATIFLEYILFPAWTVMIAFPNKTWKEFVKMLALYWGVNFLAGGFLGFFYDRFPQLLESGYYILTLLAALLFFTLFVKKGMEIVRENFERKETHLPVILKIGEKSICTVGFLDTGNRLKEPISKKPVVLMEKELLQKEGIRLLEHNYYAIPYHSVGKKAGILRGFIADEMIVGKEPDARKVKQVMIGICEERVSMEGEYSLILNPML